MIDIGIQPSIKSFNALIAACKRNGLVDEALRLIQEMQISNDKRLKIEPDTFTFSSAISVCVEGKRWPLALELLEEMERRNITRNIITYNSVIEALDR